MRIEEQHSKGNVLVTDAELLHCSSMLSVIAQWEALLEDVCYIAICEGSQVKVNPERLISSWEENDARRLLLYPNKKYIGIQSLNEFRDYSRCFIKEGLPFSAVSESNSTRIQQSIYIRNAIAHRSKHSKEIFLSKVPGVSALANSKRTPGALLRHVFRQSPVQRRYEQYFAAYRGAAVEISASW